MLVSAILFKSAHCTSLIAFRPCHVSLSGSYARLPIRCGSVSGIGVGACRGGSGTSPVKKSRTADTTREKKPPPLAMVIRPVRPLWLASEMPCVMLETPIDADRQPTTPDSALHTP